MNQLPARPTLRVSADAYRKLWLYVQLAEGEVGGLGSVELEPDGSGFVMTDSFLIEQRATDVDTEIEPAAASQFLLDFVAADKDPAVLRVWWHSHAREGVFWSADDERTIDQFGGEWLVSVVGNKAGKWLARFDRYEPTRETIGWLDLVANVELPATDSPLANEVRAELAQRVRVQRRTTNKLWTDGDLPKRHG